MATQADRLMRRIDPLTQAEACRVAMDTCVQWEQYEAGYGPGDSYRLADGSSVQYDGRGWRAVQACGHERGQCLGCDAGEG